MEQVIWFKDINMDDVHRVGGKNASLGEMYQHLSSAGVSVPNGFATTAEAYREFLSTNKLYDKIKALLSCIDVDDVKALQAAGKQIRAWICEGSFSPAFDTAVRHAYVELTNSLDSQATFAVRSSATAEDLPNASFAGQQETFLNVSGIDQIFHTMKEVFASLYNDRAIAYRVHQGFKHEDVALSVGVQQMVRSDCASSGVMFSVDTETGFDKVVFITSSYGLGEMVVQGAVNPDEFYVFKTTLAQKKQAIIRKTLGSKLQQMIYSENKTERVKIIPVDPALSAVFSLSDKDAHTLARYAVAIEKHYQRPMDIEWAKDGVSGDLFIVQARPETVVSQANQTIERFTLGKRSAVLCEGRAIGQKIGSGCAKIIKTPSEMHSVQTGDVLVTDMTDPDWEPVMKRASAIVTNRGGRTCHAAIIARELGIPAVVGCGSATGSIQDGQAVTVSCAEGDTGFIYDGILPFKNESIDVAKMPSIKTKIMMNVGNPDRAFDFQKLPNEGVGLARLEFIINRMIGIHPQAILDYDGLDKKLKAELAVKMAGYETPKQFYIESIAQGVATIAAAFYPKPVIVRLSDFKSNEYAHLMAGKLYEPQEENPMIGYRGASRYVSPSFAECFAMECEAMLKVRNEMGLSNVQVMIPFVRTLDEAKEVVELLADNGLRRGVDGLKLIMMCEIPSNALLADQFLKYFDGFSIGSNDLTQLTLGLDRDSALVAPMFNEQDPSVKYLISLAIKACLEQGKYIGICGQGPSDYPAFAQWLLDQNIESISLNPDTVIQTWLDCAKSDAAVVVA